MPFVGAAAGAGFADGDAAELREGGFEMAPDPAGEVFAGGVFEAGDVVEVAVVELVVEGAEGGFEVGEIHDPSGGSADGAGDMDGHVEGVSVEAGALVVGGDVGEAVSRLEGEFLEDFHVGAGCGVPYPGWVGHAETVGVDSCGEGLAVDFSRDGAVGDAEGSFDLLFDGEGLIEVETGAEEFAGAAVAVLEPDFESLGGTAFSMAFEAAAVELGEVVSGEVDVAQPGDGTVTDAEAGGAGGDSGTVEQGGEAGVGEGDADGDVPDGEDDGDPGCSGTGGHGVPEEEEAVPGDAEDEEGEHGGGEPASMNHDGVAVTIDLEGAGQGDVGARALSR